MEKGQRYIEMCRKAEEIQKLKEVNKEIYTKSISSVNIVASDFKGNFWINIYNKMWVWLPRQDQLQRIYIKNNTSIEFTSVKHKLDWMFVNFSKFRKAESFIPNSFEETWLLFVMKTIYQKIWKDSSWISMPICKVEDFLNDFKKKDAKNK